MRKRSRRALAGFSLVELLAVLAIVSVLAALLLGAAGPAQSRAKRVRCQKLLHQFHLIAAVYSQENDGRLPRFSEFLNDTPLLCLGDSSRGARGITAYGSAASYSASPFVFASRDRLDALEPRSWMLTEFEPYHDRSRLPGAQPNTWDGRFVVLMADGSTTWDRMEQ